MCLQSLYCLYVQCVYKVCIACMYIVHCVYKVCPMFSGWYVLFFLNTTERISLQYNRFPYQSYEIVSLCFSASTWPEVLDDTNARNDWAWDPKFTLENMVPYMLQKVRDQIGHE